MAECPYLFFPGTWMSFQWLKKEEQNNQCLPYPKLLLKFPAASASTVNEDTDRVKQIRKYKNWVKSGKTPEQIKKAFKMSKALYCFRAGRSWAFAGDLSICLLRISPKKPYFWSYSCIFLLSLADENVWIVPICPRQGNESLTVLTVSV